MLSNVLPRPVSPITRNGTSRDTMTEAEKKTIVYIEDDPEMIKLMRIILSRKGIELIGALGGKHGLETIRRVKPDLVLLDLMMPEMDGWEVYAKMRDEEETRDIPVIIVTVRAESVDKALGLYVAKVEDYLTKPFHVQELLSSVCEVLGIEP